MGNQNPFQISKNLIYNYEPQLLFYELIESNQQMNFNNSVQNYMLQNNLNNNNQMNINNGNFNQFNNSNIQPMGFNSQFPC